MAYSDGLMLLPGGLSPVTGATVRTPDWTPRTVSTAAADLAQYSFPFPVQIEGLALVVTTDLVANATKAVFSIDVTEKGGSRTEKLTLTIDATKLKRGNGNKAAQTALVDEADIDVGDVILASGTKLPIKVPAGADVFVEHKTASGAGGAVIPVLLIRAAGFDNQSTNTLI